MITVPDSRQFAGLKRIHAAGNCKSVKIATKIFTFSASGENLD